jgi:hypothetical protein
LWRKIGFGLLAEMNPLEKHDPQYPGRIQDSGDPGFPP